MGWDDQVPITLYMNSCTESTVSVNMSRSVSRRRAASVPDLDTDDKSTVALKKEIGLFSACGIIIGKSKNVCVLSISAKIFPL